MPASAVFGLLVLLRRAPSPAPPRAASKSPPGLRGASPPPGVCEGACSAAKRRPLSGGGLSGGRGGRSVSVRTRPRDIDCWGSVTTAPSFSAGVGGAFSSASRCRRAARAEDRRPARSTLSATAPGPLPRRLAAPGASTERRPPGLTDDRGVDRDRSPPAPLAFFFFAAAAPVAAAAAAAAGRATLVVLALPAAAGPVSVPKVGRGEGRLPLLPPLLGVCPPSSGGFKGLPSPQTPLAPVLADVLRAAAALARS